MRTQENETKRFIILDAFVDLLGHIERNTPELRGAIKLTIKKRLDDTQLRADELASIESFLTALSRTCEACEHMVQELRDNHIDYLT